ncbi:MAG: hypothetical protein AAF236_16830 [Verrucomicrobiota bacterium]
MQASDLRSRYLEAIKDGYWPWAERHPRDRFSEYDQFRKIWCSELHNWLFGDNTREVSSLTEFAWTVQHDCLSGEGKSIICLNWSDRNQRVYLGDGLLEYLGLLKDDIEAAYTGQNSEGQLSAN